MADAFSGKDDSDEDSALFMAYAAGDMRAFDTLYKKHKPWLFRKIWRMVGDPAIAEDIFNEVWISAIKHRTDYEPRAKFSSFLHTIANSRIMDYFRKSGRAVPTKSIEDEDGIADSLASVATSALDAVLGREMIARFEHCLRALPDAQRIVFLFREDAELQWAEIAALIAAPLETARARHRYALSKLRHCMGDLCPVS